MKKTTSILHHRGCEIRVTPTASTFIRPRGRAWWRGPVVATVHIAKCDGSWSRDYLVQQTGEGSVTLVSRFGGKATDEAPIIGGVTATDAALRFVEFVDEWKARREGRWVDATA